MLWAIRQESGREHLYWIYDELQASDVKLDHNIYFAFMVSAAMCQALDVGKAVFRDFTSKPIPAVHRQANFFFNHQISHGLLVCLFFTGL